MPTGLGLLLLACQVGVALPVSPLAHTAPADLARTAGTQPTEQALRAEQSDWQSKLDSAISAIASESDNPERAARAIRLRLINSNLCYASNMSGEQLEALMRDYLLRPVALQGPVGDIQDRFVSDYNVSNESANLVWVGEGNIGPRGQGLRANLTYSFPADGTSWGLSASGFSPASNALGAALTSSTVFNTGNLDKGREYIRQSLAAWRKYTGLTYSEVADDNTPTDTSNGRSPNRGDIRIGGIPLGTNGVLAYNAFPTTGGVGPMAGGDMCINTSYFISNNLANTNNDYRYLRTTVSHEHGHGLGYIHVVPCTFTKVMEPQISGTNPGMSVDERRGGAFNYGDRFAGNQSSAAATDFGNLTLPLDRSVIQRDLALNRAGAPNNTAHDWFKFTVSSSQVVTITADPTGGTYANDEQNTGCTGKAGTPVPTVNADEAGNISLYLLSSGLSVIGTANGAAAGVAESISQTLNAGTYFIHVVNDGNVNGAETDPNKLVQLYDLEVRVGVAFAPPWPVAGINKRVQANTLCWFNSINSQANESGATIPTNGYEWDLQGDGTFDTVANARPSFTYVSNGVYDVSLRVTDSNGESAVDTIQVTVYGATGSVSSISPPTGQRATSFPITISGSNFKGVTNANQVSIEAPSGSSGVTVSGTPSVNKLGTSITGLTATVTAGAALGTRNIRITNADGQSTVIFTQNVFTVTIAGGPPANDECSAPVSWGNTTGAKAMSNVGATNSPDQSFPSTFCPASSPINNDVWYSWTCPTTGNLTVTNNSQSQGFDSRIAIYSNTCPTSTAALLACDDFGAAITLSVTAGTTYLFRCGSTIAENTGSATVTLNVTVPPPPTGACCNGTSCVITTQALCPPGIYKGDSVSCGSFNNPTACCPANFNQVSGVNADDLFAFLDAWFIQNGSSGPGFSADLTRDNLVNPDDLFAFLDAWFLGC